LTTTTTTTAALKHATLRSVQHVVH